VIDSPIPSAKNDTGEFDRFKNFLALRKKL
jgi:hypothetical protein